MRAALFSGLSLALSTKGDFLAMKRRYYYGPGSTIAVYKFQDDESNEDPPFTLLQEIEILSGEYE